MFGHFPIHMISKYFAIDTQRLRAKTAIQIQLNPLMFITIAKFLRFLTNFNPLMFRWQFTGMVILIALSTKMSILRNTKYLRQLLWYFTTILTNWSLGLLLFVRIHNKVNNITRQHLIILEYHVLMFEYLRVLVLVVEVDWLETFRAWNWVA